MTIFHKFRRSLKLDKNTQPASDLGEVSAAPASFCHACGQRTPQRSTFGASFSPSSSSATQDGDDLVWKQRPRDYQRSDSGYSSFTYSTRLSVDDSCDNLRSSSIHHTHNQNSWSSTLGSSGRGGRSSRTSGGNQYYAFDASPPESPTEETVGGHAHAKSCATTMPDFTMTPPRRQATYSSSIYSTYDDDEDDRNHNKKTEAFPPLPVMVEDYDYGHHDYRHPHGDHHDDDDDDGDSNLSNDHALPPPRTSILGGGNNNSSSLGSFQPLPPRTGKSRYARLNDLPVLSPRASVFTFGSRDNSDHDDDHDHNDYSYDHYRSDEQNGERRNSDGEKRNNNGKRRTRFTKSLSVSIMPSQLRRLSLGGAKKD